MPLSTLPPGPEYREVPGCPGYMAASDGSLWSCWTLGRWPKRTEIWLPVRNRSAKKASAHVNVIIRTASGFRVTEFLHRIILTTFVGPCPEGMVACHDPDPDPTNNAIVNLRWATPTANVEDCKRHGRFACGSKHPNAKIRDEDVPLIFQLRRLGAAHDTIAQRFGVRRVCITRVLLSKRYAHIETDRTNPIVRGKGNYARGSRQARAKLTEEKVSEMKHLRRQGWLQKALAERYGVSTGTVCSILNGKEWKHVE